MARIPIFRSPFKHTALKRIGVPDGLATPAFLAQVAANTNLLIAQKRHMPPVQQTHDGAPDGLARGWVNQLESDGRTLFAEVDLTEKGRALIAGKELRFLSSSFRRDFALTGEPEGEKLTGPYLAHLALLGDQLPAVKALTDLAEVVFDEASADRAWIVEDEQTGEITYFAERSSSEGEQEKMTLEELKAQNEKLAADFAEEKAKREAAEAKLAEVEKAQADAKFAEHKANVKQAIDGAVAAKRLTAEKAIELTALGEKAYGNEVAEAIFAETIANLAPVAVPGEQIPPDPKAEAITAADFTAANAGDLAASAKVSAAFHEAKTKTPTLTYLDFAAQFAE